MESTAGRIHSRILRRTLLEFVRLFNERTDSVVKLLAIALAASFLIDRFWNVSEVVERVLTLLHFIVAFGVVTYFLGRRFLFKDATVIWSRVLTDKDCRSLRDWLRTGEEPTGEACLCLTEFASAASIEELVAMNYEGFRDTAFATEQDRLLHRNQTWIKKNPRVFMLMRDPIGQKEYIGYSAMVPLTEDGTDLYLKGKLEDADIPAALICGADERPASIIVFAIVLKPEFSFSQSGASRQYSHYFWGCIRKHVRELYPDLFRAGDYPPIYAQAERTRMRDRLKSVGFEPSGMMSADGFELWVLKSAVRPVPAIAAVTGEGNAPAPPI